jgi:hypothetical protein
LRGWDLKRDDLEIGFLNISIFFAKLKIHFGLYFALLAFLQLYFVYYSFKDEKQLFPYLGLVLIFGGQYLMWMNGIRQALAASIFVYSIQFILKRNFIKYLLVIISATLCHQSAIALIIFYFIPNYNYFKNEFICVLLIFGSITIGLNPYWLSANESLSKIIALIGYDEYADSLNTIIVERSKEMAFGPRRIITTIQNVFIAFGFYNLFRRTRSKEVLLFFNFSFLGALHYNLFANAGSIFLRPTYYLTIFTPIIVAYLLSNYSKSWNKARIWNFIILLILSISNLIVAIISDSNNDDLDFTNFKFFWNHI